MSNFDSKAGGLGFSGGRSEVGGLGLEVEGVEEVSRGHLRGGQQASPAGESRGAQARWHPRLDPLHPVMCNPKFCADLCKKLV